MTAADVAAALGRDLPEPIGGPFAQRLMVAFDVFDVGRTDSKRMLAKLMADGFSVQPASSPVGFAVRRRAGGAR